MNIKIPKFKIPRCHDWHSINWKLVTEEVQAIQDKITVAAKDNDHSEVRRLQTLAVRKFSFRAMAVRIVTTNRGRFTPISRWCKMGYGH